MINDGILQNTVMNNASIILFGPFIKIAQETFNYMISLLSEEKYKDTDQSIKDSIYRFSSFMLSSMITIIERAPELSDDCSNANLYSLVSSYLICNMKLFAKEILEKVENTFDKDIKQIGEIDCKCEFHPLAPYQSTINDNRIHSIIPIPKDDDLKMHVFDATKDYISQCAQSFNTPEYYQKIVKQSPRFEKLLTIQFKSKKDSLFIQNVLMKLTPMILSDYSLFGNNVDDTKYYSENALILFFLINLILVSSNETNSQLFHFFDLINILPNLFVFDEKYFPLVKDEKYSQFNPVHLFLYSNLRYSVMTIINRNFINFPSEIIELLITKISTTNSLEISNLFQILLNEIYAANIPEFLHFGMNNEKLFVILADYIAKMRKCFYDNVKKYAELKALNKEIDAEQQKGILKFFHEVHECRKSVMLFLILLTLESNTIYTLYSKEIPVTLMADECFESIFSKIALDFLRHGLEIVDTHYDGNNVKSSKKSPLLVVTRVMMRFMLDCVRQSEKIVEDKMKYLNLIYDTLIIVTKSIQVNQQSLVNAFVRCNALTFLYSLPERLIFGSKKQPNAPIANDQNSELEELKIDILDQVIYITCALAVGNNEFKKISYKHLIKFANFLKKLTLKDSTINALLQLLFEKEVSLHNLPEMCEILFNHALIIIHTALEKDYQHYLLVFDYISKIAYRSYANRLHIFQANFPHFIVNYLTRQNISNAITNEPNEEIKAKIKSTDVLWKIYQIVSTDLYKPSTFVNAFYLMKVKNKKRHWYTNRILSIFGEVLSTKVSQKTASSYFHFSGRKSGIYVPRIDLTTKNQPDETNIKKVAQQDESSDNEVANGTWTFCCVFLIDNIVYEYSIENSCLVSFTSQSTFPSTSNKKVAPSKLKLVLEPPNMFLVFESPAQNFSTLEKLHCKFRPCVWYNLVITISKLKFIKIYVDGNKFFHKNIPQLDLSPVLENFSIANSFSCPFSINKNYNVLSIRNQKNQEMINDMMMNLHSDNDSSLICNLACCYLFSKKLSHILVSDIAKLPFDYVYSFISSNQYLFRNLPESLFTGEIEQSLVFCYNARLCDNKNVCINLKRNGKVGNAIFRGDIVPYNLTSITSFGGLKIFLPLFDQIDLPIDYSNDVCHIKEDTDDEIINERRKFLVTLLNIFNACIHLSEEVENTFCNENGIKALCHALTSINPEDWSIDAFKVLNQLYASLRSDTDRFEMVQYILVNPNVWNKLSIRNHDELKDVCLMNILQFKKNKEEKDIALLNIFLKYASFTHFLITVCTIRNDEIRQIYWNVIVAFARYNLIKPNETQRLFIFTFSDDSFYLYHDVSYINQIQALKSLLRIVSNKYGDFHMFLTNTNHFYHFILLSQSKSEVIRMYGLKFLLLIKDYLEAKVIIDIPPIPIHQAFTAYINLMCLESVTDYSWDELLKLVFKEDAKESNFDSFSFHRIVDVLPFMAILSNFMKYEQINALGKNILKSIDSTFDPFQKSIDKQRGEVDKKVNFCELISSSLNWVENIFYIFIQGSSPFDFNKKDDENYVLYTQIFAKIFTHMLLSERTNQFTNCLNTLNSIQYYTKLNVASFIRSIFIEMLKLLNDFVLSSEDDKIFHGIKNGYENLYTNLISNVFLFLMIVPSFESNKNSDSEQNNEIIDIINEKITYKDFIENQVNQQVDKSKLEASFSPRFDKNGKWIDQELAELFSTFLTNSFDLHLKTKNHNFGTVQIFSKQTRIIDVFALNEMVLMKASNKSFNDIDEHKFSFLDGIPKSNIEAFLICISIIIKYSFENQKEENAKFNDLIIIISSYIKSHPVIKPTTLTTSQTETSNSNDPGASNDDDAHIAFNFSSDKAREFISSIESHYQSNILNLSKSYASTITNLVNSYKLKTTKFPVVPIDGTFFTETTEQYISTLSHMAGICENAYKDLKRDVLKNSGLWKSNESDPAHWMLSPYLDNEFRHIIFEPNYHFTDHMDASIRRDVGDESIAKVKIAELAQNKEDNKRKEDGMSNDNQKEKENNEETETTENDANATENESENNKKYIVNTQARLVTIEGNFAGFLSMNGKEIFFTGTLEDDDELLCDSFSSSSASKDYQKLDESARNIDKRPMKSIEISLKNIVMILRRNYLHIKSAFEIFLKTNRSYFFFLPNNDRRNIFRFMSKQNMPNLKYFQMTSDQNSFIDEFKITEKWQRKKISNYQYLVCLNLYAGRSFNDLSQYPVFPWVLTNYKSDELDLNDTNNFRDLSKPLGTLNEERLEKLKFSCENRPEEELPPFLYRLHYSTAYNVCAFMIRVEPFTSIYLKLNGGRFDIKERIINSIGQIWDAVTSYQNEFRELIPEVYTTPEIFMNYNKIDLGGINKAEHVNSKFRKSDIELIINGEEENIAQVDYYKGTNDFLLLPPWAHSNPFLFISKHREALESDFVSMHLNEWIDLIFGCKQMGELAEKANNTFHPYSYPSFVTPQVLKDKELMRDIQMKIRDFGITPFQIFKYEYHPTRFEPVIGPSLGHQASGPISFIASFFKRKNSNKAIPSITSNESNDKTNDYEENTPNNDNENKNNNNNNNNSTQTQNEVENNMAKQFFGHFHSVTEFNDENRPVFVSGNRKITVVFTINAHLYIFKNLHKNSKNEDQKASINKDQNKADVRYVLLSLYDISQFVTLTELKSRRLRNCCTLYDNTILMSKLQGQKMNFFIVSSPDDISFHIFEINENTGAVSHITSSHGQALLKQIVSAPNSTAFLASSRDTSLTCYLIKGEGQSSVFANPIFSQQAEAEPRQSIGVVSQVISVTSALTSFISPITLSPKKASNAQLASCSSVPSLANTSIDLDKTFRIMTHSAPIVDLYESATENMFISADEMNKVIFTSLVDGSYIRSLNFTKVPKVKIILNDDCDPNLINLFKSVTTNTSDNTKLVTLNARQRVKLVMISDGLPCALIATILNVFLPNQNSNLKLNANSNNNSNANVSDFSSTSGLFSTGPQYFLTQDENSLILSDMKDTLLVSNENTNDSNINENINVILNHSQFDINESNNNQNDTISNINFNENEKSFNSTHQDIDSKQKLNNLNNNNYIIRTVLYSYDLDAHLINYKIVDSKIISWCEVKSNASNTSKLVVAFSNKSLCAYSLPGLELISSITLPNVPTMIYYNVDRNKLIIVQEGSDYSVSALNLGT